MNTPRRPVIVILGMMTSVPVGGVTWQTVQYLLGFQRLGFDVYYAEDHGMLPRMFVNERDPLGTDGAAQFLAQTMERFGLGDRWSYHSWPPDDRYFGLSRSAVDDLCARAAAVINLHGTTTPREEFQAGGAFIYLETDPVAPQIELHNGVRQTAEFLDAHTAHFTYGENLGAADCKVPVPPARYTFHPTRQPILLDLWEPHGRPPGDCFTTIANWRQPEREMTFEGEVYRWSKHHEFERFINLPRRARGCFELALSSYEAADQVMLESHGWKVRRALDFSADADAYRDYITQSRGEWTVAKDQNVRLRSGWFSDRAASYLAAGRPVVTQETGFSNLLPTGRGLFPFTTMEETLAALQEIESDYEKHSRAAVKIAREHFGYEAVLKKLLSDARVSLPTLS